MRRKTSKEILAESFRELADIKPIDKITIKDIVDNCGYSPATFYRQFKDKYDLVACCLFTHRRVIKALIKHEPMPKAPKWHCWVKKENRRE